MIIFQVITQSDLGGAQSVVINLSNQLCKNHDVIVLAGAFNGQMFDLLDKKITIEKIKTLKREISPIDEVKTIIKLKKLYKKYKPDIIHLHSSKAGLLGRLSFKPNKIIYTVHGFDSIRLKYSVFLPLEKKLQYRTSAIVGVSKYDEFNLKKEGIVKNIYTIYNGVNEYVKIDYNPFYNYSRERKKILCIARLAPPKNINLFIEIANNLPMYDFFWIGNQISPDFDYPDNVHFLGCIPNAATYISYADLFILPSDYEGLPIVIIESLSQGIPVVASNVGGVSEILDGENGFAVENNVTNFSEKIEFILNLSAMEKKKYELNARKTFKEKFDISMMVQNYINLYEKMLKK